MDGKKVDKALYSLTHILYMLVVNLWPYINLRSSFHGIAQKTFSGIPLYRKRKFNISTKKNKERLHENSEPRSVNSRMIAIYCRLCKKICTLIQYYCILLHNIKSDLILLSHTWSEQFIYLFTLKPYYCIYRHYINKHKFLAEKKEKKRISYFCNFVLRIVVMLWL